MADAELTYRSLLDEIATEAVAAALPDPDGLADVLARSCFYRDIDLRETHLDRARVLVNQGLSEARDSASDRAWDAADDAHRAMVGAGRSGHETLLTAMRAAARKAAEKALADWQGIIFVIILREIKAWARAIPRVVYVARRASVLGFRRVSRRPRRRAAAKRSVRSHAARGAPARPRRADDPHLAGTRP